MKVIGLTGGSGAGKSTVLRIFERLGAYAIDADALYNSMLRVQGPLMERLESLFPQAFSGGQLDKRILGSIVFNDPDALALLNSATHPLVLREADKLITLAGERGHPAVVVDAIALFASGFGGRCDATVGVLAPRECRIARVMARDNITREQAESRIDAQPGEGFYRERCGYLIKNTGDFSALERDAAATYNAILL